MGWCGSEGRIQYQHADAKMQVRGWTNAVYGDPVRLWLLFRRTSKKTRYPGGRKCGLPKNADGSVPMCVCVWTARGAPRIDRHPRLLHVDEEIALEDVLPFLVLLGLFVRLVLQPNARRPVSRKGMDRMGQAKACSHISSRVWSCTCSNRCPARCGCP